MLVLVSVKSAEQSIKDMFEKSICTELETAGFSIENDVPEFGVEIITEDIPDGKNDEEHRIALSIIFSIYYYLFDYIQAKDETVKNDELKIKMFHFSRELENSGKYSTGFNGVYKHNGFHHMMFIKKEEITSVCSLISGDFIDMVKAWQNQTSYFSMK